MPSTAHQIANRVAAFMPGANFSTSHTSAQGKKPVDDTARNAAAVQAKRMVKVAKALRDGLALDALN